VIIVADKIMARVEKEPLVGHAVLIRRGHILEIGSQKSIISAHRHDPVIRLDRTILLPGLVNVHTHLELPSLRIASIDHTYSSWVLNLLKAKSGLKFQDYRSAVRNNIKDSICSGTTTLGDISTHGVSTPILRKTGLRAMIYDEIIAMRPDRKLVLPRRYRDTILIRHGLSPHSPHTVSAEHLSSIHSYAQMRGVPLCMHVAESRDEQLLLNRKKSPLDRLYATVNWDREWAPRTDSTVHYLKRIGILGPRFLAVHTVHINGNEIRMLARSGASVAHCPRSNRALRAGTMDLRAMLDAGINVGLGTDSLASVSNLNLWDEMRFAYKLHRKSGVSAQDILYTATMGGARALGMGKEIGSLEPGKKADIIAVPLPRRDTGDIHADLIRETQSSMMTLVNGSVLYMRSH
jgi:cytosine/adenosine deaminase-related metal-dependent hydrolase